MATSIHHDSIKSAMIEQLARDRSNEKRSMEKRDIKKIIDDVKEFLEQTRFFKKPDNFGQFRRYQV